MPLQLYRWTWHDSMLVRVLCENVGEQIISQVGTQSTAQILDRRWVKLYTWQFFVTFLGCFEWPPFPKCRVKWLEPLFLRPRYHKNSRFSIAMNSDYKNLKQSIPILTTLWSLPSFSSFSLIWVDQNQNKFFLQQSWFSRNWPKLWKVTTVDGRSLAAVDR